MSVPQARSERGVTLAQGWWGERRRSDGYWRDRSSWRERSRGRDSGSWGWSDDEDEYEARPRYSENRGTYRTLCVRLCDGFYWPISYATTPEYFGRDRRKCESSCGAPVRLYKYPNPGDDPESMEDLNGRPYSRLKTAFLYRTKYDSSCKCKSDPWEQEATDRHRMYALQAAKRKGDKVAAQELDLLEARMEEARKMAAGGKVATAPGGAADQSYAVPGEDGVPPAPSPARNERMSLGARSAPPVRHGAPPARVWGDMAETAP